MGGKSSEHDVSLVSAKTVIENIYKDLYNVIMVGITKDGQWKLVSTLPAYLNALEGKGVHIVTVNDYLAKRDANWMGQVHQFLGLSVGVILNSYDNAERQAAYNCDITYITNNELGFDYLRDNMVIEKEDLVQRDLHYAILLTFTPCSACKNLFSIFLHLFGNA